MDELRGPSSPGAFIYLLLIYLLRMCTIPATFENSLQQSQTQTSNDTTTLQAATIPQPQIDLSTTVIS